MKKSKAAEALKKEVEDRLSEIGSQNKRRKRK